MIIILWLLALVSFFYGIKKIINCFGHGGHGSLLFALSLSFVSFILFVAGKAAVDEN